MKEDKGHMFNKKIKEIKEIRKWYIIMYHYIATTCRAARKQQPGFESTPRPFVARLSLILCLASLWLSNKGKMQKKSQQLAAVLVH